MNATQRFSLGVFIGLLLLCASLMVGANFLGAITRESVLPIATDGFKTVLGALVGVLSTFLGGRRDPD